MKSQTNLTRFERDAKLASSLEHPNICTIFGLHKVDDIHFIAMQYVNGRNVRQLVGGPLVRRKACLQISYTRKQRLSLNLLSTDCTAARILTVPAFDD